MNGLRGEYERKFHIYQVLSQAKFDELNSLNKEMHKKYGELLAKEVKKVDELYFKKPNVYESPCGAQELMILECYKNNPKQTLRCSGHVKEFAACIDRARLSVLHTNTRKWARENSVCSWSVAPISDRIENLSLSLSHPVVFFSNLPTTRPGSCCLPKLLNPLSQYL